MGENDKSPLKTSPISELINNIRRKINWVIKIYNEKRKLKIQINCSFGATERSSYQTPSSKKSKILLLVTSIWPNCRLNPTGCSCGIYHESLFYQKPASEACLQTWVNKEPQTPRFNLPENTRSILLASIGHQEAFKCVIRATEGLNCWINILPVWFMICSYTVSKIIKRSIRKPIGTCNHTCQPSKEWQKGELSVTPFYHLHADTATTGSIKETPPAAARAADTFALFHSRSHQISKKTGVTLTIPLVRQFTTEWWLNHWMINVMDWGCDENH